MILAHKIQLKPNKTQITGLKKATGCATNNLLTLGYRGNNACGQGSAGSALLSETAVEAGISVYSHFEHVESSR